VGDSRRFFSAGSDHRAGRLPVALNTLRPALDISAELSALKPSKISARPDVRIGGTAFAGPEERSGIGRYESARTFA
jgi:hypothetical protein